MEKVSNTGRILLTGPRGSIGSLYLQQLPRKKQEQLTVIDITKPKNLPKGIRFHKIDLTEPAVDGKIAELLKKEQIDTVIHASIFWNPSRRREHAHEVEVIGTMHLLNACHEHEVRKFILVSSTIVYGAKATNPNFIEETAPLYGGFSNRYLRDKVELEEEVRKFRKRHPKTVVTVLRPCMVIGPRVQNFATGMLANPVIPSILGYDPLVQFIHESDVLRALRLSIVQDHHGEFNLVGEGVMPLSYAIKLAGRVNLPLIYSLAKPTISMLWHSNLVEFPPQVLDFLRYIWVADGQKAATQMGFKPRYSSKEALESYCGQQRLKKVHLEPLGI
jgi:UDP-glucose 4-epimerase